MSQFDFKRGDKAEFKNQFGDTVEVNVMAVADDYAMVRRPRCTPFCIPVKQLQIKEQDEDYLSVAAAKAACEQAEREQIEEAYNAGLRDAKPNL